jgi:hypothetical protein
VGFRSIVDTYDHRACEDRNQACRPNQKKDNKRMYSSYDTHLEGFKHWYPSNVPHRWSFLMIVEPPEMPAMRCDSMRYGGFHLCRLANGILLK